MGYDAFSFKYGDDSGTLILRNLPKLSSLTTSGEIISGYFSFTFENPRHITVENMPNLTNVTLTNYAFQYYWDIQYSNTGALADHPNIPNKNPNATVRTVNELKSLDSSVTQIIIDNGVGEPGFTVLDLTRFTQLKSLEIGYHCLSYVTIVKMIGLSELESVEIGEHSFTKYKNRNDISADPNRHFYLKNCPKLKSLKMGRYSFSDYSVIEIENVDALEMIEMGGYSFYYAPLELKNLPSLKSLMFGYYAFCDCSRVVFENLPELTSIQMGYSAFRFKYGESSTLIMRSDSHRVT